MTSVWVAEQGWCYLNAAIDCCTREIIGWAVDVRCRAAEAIAVIERAVADRNVRPDSLTLGSDNGTAFTSRAFRARLAEHGITHRRGGYRDPESQAFIESWFSKLKQRCVWREEFETLDQARAVIGAQRRPLPPPAPLRTGLPHAARGRGHLERSRRPPNPSGLTVNTDGVQASSASIGFVAGLAAMAPSQSHAFARRLGLSEPRVVRVISTIGAARRGARALPRAPLR